MSRRVAIEASEHQILQLSLGRPHEKLASLYSQRKASRLQYRAPKMYAILRDRRGLGPGNMRYLVAGYPAGGIFRPAIRTRLL